MRQSELRLLLEQVQRGALSPAEAAAQLQPAAELGFASLDVHRESRSGQPEAVYAEGKELTELVPIVASTRSSGRR